jgi:hypothetical protein
MRWTGNAERMGEIRGAYRVSVGKAKVLRQFRRTRHRWEDNLKIDFQKVGWGHGLDRSDYGLGQVAGTCECGNELRFP